MKPLDRVYGSFLARMTRGIQSYLELRVRDSRLNLQSVRVYPTDTFGWEADILRLRQIPGTLQLWLDLFPNIGRPVLAICYNSGDLDRVTKVAETFTDRPHEKVDFSRTHLGPWQRGCSVLAKPLPNKYFGVPLVETYQSNFFTVYLPDQLDVRRQIPARLIRKVSRLCERMFRAVASALEAKSANRADFVGFENRQVVVQHLRRERSAKLALMAKMRDGFTCRVCQFNFADTYGDIGRGFAEAHHLVPLSNLTKRTQRRVKDLITICPNCHRMLHRMDGHPKDVRLLRGLVRRRK